MRQCTGDCYDIMEQSACLTQASNFYIALTQPSMICNGNGLATCRVSVYTLLVVLGYQEQDMNIRNGIGSGKPLRLQAKCRQF